MMLEFSYLEGLYSYGGVEWTLNGKDLDGNDVSFYVRYVHIEQIVQKEMPEINELRQRSSEVRIPILYDYFRAENVKATLLDQMLTFNDERILEYRRCNGIDPDHPRNLAKCVTVK